MLHPALWLFLLYRISELTKLFTQQKVFAVGIADKSCAVKMELARRIHIAVIDCHTDHFCKEQIVAA